MPKDRSKKSGRRKVKRRLFIVCEGEKTEPFYFDAFIARCNFRGKPVKVEVVKTSETSARELVEKAHTLREIPSDEVWAAFDKNGYTRHWEAFAKARAKKVNIAFSSIAFEYWILLHFEYTTRAFENSLKIAAYLKHKNYLDFKKNDRHIFHLIKGNTSAAAANAKKIRQYQENASPGKKVYELNPYTNVDELLDAIELISQLYN